MFGQKTIKATTRAQVDAAFARADKIVVEGDDALLSYAATKAARDARTQGADVAIDTAGGKPVDQRLQRIRAPEIIGEPIGAPPSPTVYSVFPPFPAGDRGDPFPQPPPSRVPIASPSFPPAGADFFGAFEPPPAPPPPVPRLRASGGGAAFAPARGSTRRFTVLGAAALLLVTAGVLVFLLLKAAPIQHATFASQTPRLLDKQTLALLKSKGFSDQAIEQIRTGIAPDPLGQKTPAPDTVPAPAAPGPASVQPPSKQASAGVLQALPAIIWSIVGLVAVLGLIFVARQAINNDRNVEVSWKVSEKISGRLVITKVARPRGRVPKAA